MGTRGRKSAAELALIGPNGVETRRRLEAPADLSTEQAEVWRGVVNTLPADWFGPGSAPVLAALCRHTVAARRVGSWLARLQGGRQRPRRGALAEAPGPPRARERGGVVAGQPSAADAAVTLWIARCGD